MRAFLALTVSVMLQPCKRLAVALAWPADRTKWQQTATTTEYVVKGTIGAAGTGA